jgi:signal transduction histidine kinase
VSGIEHAALAGWPLVLTLTAIGVRERVRKHRRREALNRALHELRRPLQSLVLASGRSGGNGSAPGRLELALEALAQLDREINGGKPCPPRLRPVLCRSWVDGAVARWQVAAMTAGRRIEVRWRAGSARVLADPRRLAQALDNLIVNAIEHGRAPLRVEGSLSLYGVRIAVTDGGSIAFTAIRRSRRRRRHGLAVVASVAEEHGGRFALRPGPRGTVAALELPLAKAPLPAAVSAKAA